MFAIASARTPDGTSTMLAAFSGSFFDLETLRLRRSTLQYWPSTRNETGRGAATRPVSGGSALANRVKNVSKSSNVRVRSDSSRSARAIAGCAMSASSSRWASRSAYQSKSSRWKPVSLSQESPDGP